MKPLFTLVNQLLCLALFIVQWQVISTKSMDYPPDMITKALNAHAKRLADKNKTLSSNNEPSPAKTEKKEISSSTKVELPVSVSGERAPMECISQELYDTVCAPMAESEDDYYEDCECECEEEEGGESAASNSQTQTQTQTPIKTQTQTKTNTKTQSMKSQAQSTQAQATQQISTQQKSSVSIVGGSEYGILFIWPTFMDPQPHARKSQTQLAVGNEFNALVRGVWTALKHTNIPLYLATDVNVNDKETVFSNVDEDIWDRLTVLYTNQTLPAPTLHSNIKNKEANEAASATLRRHMHIPQYLAQGWRSKQLPEYVLVLDCEGLVIGSTFSSEAKFEAIFAPLRHYDVVGTFQTSSTTGLWGLSTAVLGVRASALPLMEMWLMIMQTSTSRGSSNNSNREGKGDSFVYYSSIDAQQEALMLALELLPTFRVFPLPNTYNFHHSTAVHSTGIAGGAAEPLIVRSHVYRDERVRTDKHSEVARVLSASILQDCLTDISGVGYPSEKLCGAIVE